MSAVQLQLPLRLPEDHYDLVCPHQQRELIGFTPLQQKQWHVLNREKAREALAAWVDQPDIYVTPNEFHRWRRISNARNLNALYVDIDCHTEGANDFEVMRRVEQALSDLDREKIPSPNCIIYTGRGAHLYWLISQTPAAAMPRWQACQRRLVEVCKGDSMSADATRVLRVVGTINSKNGFKVKAEPIHTQRPGFEWLADQILPLTRAEIRDLRAARAARNELDTIVPGAKAHTGSIYQRWYKVLQDCHKIANYHGGTIGAGHRDLILFHTANALSWFTVSEALTDEVTAVARKITPTLHLSEALSYTSSVLERARKTKLTGQEHRYKHKRQTLYNSLKPLIPDDLLPQLRAIIPDDLATERKLERDKTRREKIRRDAGMIERSAYIAQAENKQQKAIELKAKGLSVRAIAAELGISKSAVDRYIKAVPSVSPCIVGEAPRPLAA